MIGYGGEFTPTLDLIDAEFDRVEAERDATRMSEYRFGEVIDPRIPALRDRVDDLECALRGIYLSARHTDDELCLRCEAARALGLIETHEREAA